MDYNVYARDQMRLNMGRPVYPVGWAFDAFRSYFIWVYKATDNWFDVISVYRGNKKSAEIKFKDGREFHLTQQNFPELLALVVFYGLPKALTDKYVKKIGKDSFTAKVNGFTLVLPFTAASVIREAYYNVHSGANSKGREVVDVGAFNGDSAIYYVAVEGAKHVYAYEPVPYLFKTAKRIIKENKLERRITMFDTAVTSGKSYSGQLNKGFDKSTKHSLEKGPNITTLEQVLKNIKSRDPILKLDIEGYEYDVILNSSKENLRRFGTIYIEYHYGYRSLVEKLEQCGFNTKRTPPLYTFKGFKNKPMICGVLVAQRIG